MNEYQVGLTSDKIWDIENFIRFLALNQKKSIKLTIAPEAIDLSIVYPILDCFEFEQVEIHTHNPFEQHAKYKIIYSSFAVWTSKQNVDTSLHKWNRKKIFYCLYGRPTASRLGLAAHMLENYKEQTHIHFMEETNEDDLVHYELDKLLTYSVDIIESVGRLIKQLPILLESPERYTAFNGYDYDDPLTNYYADILIDLVVESHVLGNTFFPTEKIFRPIWMKKPFVTFATIGFNEHLKEMGFRTFNDFWSEDYDGVEGNLRFDMILNLIDKLALKSKDELEYMYYGMQEILDHNYNLLNTQTFKNVL